MLSKPNNFKPHFSDKDVRKIFFFPLCFHTTTPHRYHLGASGSRTDEAIFWSCLAPPPRPLWGPQGNELRRDVKPLWPQPGVFRRWPNRAEKYCKPGHRSVGWAKGRELVCVRLALALLTGTANAKHYIQGEKTNPQNNLWLGCTS